MTNIVTAEEILTGNGWSSITLQSGIPVQFREEKYVALEVFMRRSSRGDIKRATQSPLAKGGKDEDAAALVALTNCMAVVSSRLYTIDQAKLHLDAIDEDDLVTQEEILGTPVVLPNVAEVIYFSPDDMNSDDLMLGDFESISESFKAINRIGKRDLGDFFKLSRS